MAKKIAPTYIGKLEQSKAGIEQILNPDSGHLEICEQGSGTRITIERTTGMKFNSEIEINSNEAIIEAVQAGRLKRL